MRVTLAALLLAGTAQAQQPAIPTFLSADDVSAAISRAEHEIKPDQPTFSTPLIAANGYTARLEYRQKVGPAAIHEDDGELFYVLAGGGIVVTGGALLNGEPRPGGNLSGTGLAGGESRRIGAGDFFVIPAGAPHFFSAIDAKLVLISLHLPAAAPAKP